MSESEPLPASRAQGGWKAAAETEEEERGGEASLGADPVAPRGGEEILIFAEVVKRELFRFHSSFSSTLLLFNSPSPSAAHHDVSPTGGRCEGSRLLLFFFVALPHRRGHVGLRSQLSVVVSDGGDFFFADC